MTKLTPTTNAERDAARVEMIRLAVVRLFDRIPGLEYQARRQDHGAVALQCEETLKIVEGLTQSVGELRAIHASACLAMRPVGQGRVTA